jgi:hypothetical protein
MNSVELVVDDIDAAHDELVSRGVEVSELFHDHSAIPTATAGCCRRSRSGPRVGPDA